MLRFFFSLTILSLYFQHSSCIHKSSLFPSFFLATELLAPPESVSVSGQGQQRCVVPALWCSEALVPRKWAVRGQIDGNHTSSLCSAVALGWEGRGRTEEGEGGGRKEGGEGSEAGRQRGGGAALARAPLRIERTQIHDGGVNIHATPPLQLRQGRKGFIRCLFVNSIVSFSFLGYADKTFT